MAKINVGTSERPIKYDVYSNEKVWETNTHIKSAAKLIHRAGDYELYLAPSLESEKTFYLTSNDRYIASLDFITNKKVNNEPTVTIEYGYAKERGMYKKLMDFILMYSDFDYIMSDVNLSDRAGQFYKKLVESPIYKRELYNKFDKKVYEFDHEKAFNNNDYHIVISLK